MPTEIELKFLADTETPLDTLTHRDRLGDFPLGPAVTFDEEDRYLDTADGRLAAGIWACRLRTRGATVIASLKGPPEPTAGTAGLHRRPEVEGPADSRLDPQRWPASAARDLVLRLAAGAQLEETLRLRQRRTERTVEGETERLGTLSLDRVEIERRGRRLARLRVVELELAAGVDGDPVGHAATLSAALAAVPGLHPDPLTKLEHALAALDGIDR